MASKPFHYLDCVASPEWPTKYTDFQSWNLPKSHLCHYPLVYEPIKKNISVVYNIIAVAINYLLCASSHSATTKNIRSTPTKHLRLHTLWVCIVQKY